LEVDERNTLEADVENMEWLVDQYPLALELKTNDDGLQLVPQDLAKCTDYTHAIIHTWYTS
jgi:hypothetical protein